MAQFLDDLGVFIGERVREGFASPHEIFENASNWAYEKYGRDDLLSSIKKLTVEELSAHQAEQSG